MTRNKAITSVAKKLWLLALPVTLSGCIALLPTPVSIATYAIDGMTYLATGKTMSDHALSFVMQRDCAMTRILSGTVICYQAPASLTAFAFEKGEPYPQVLGAWEFQDMQIPPANDSLQLAGGKMPHIGSNIKTAPAPDGSIWEFTGMEASQAWIPHRASFAVPERSADL